MINQYFKTKDDMRMPGQEEVLNNKENNVRFIANKSNKSNLGSIDNLKR